MSRFDEFYCIYPKKVGRRYAQECWGKKGCESDADAIIESVEPYKAALIRSGFRKPADPSTFLNKYIWDSDWDGAYRDNERQQVSQETQTFLERRANMKLVSNG